MRYAVAKILYRIRFPRGDLSECDMRPEHQAFLVNAYSTIKPQHSSSANRDLAYKRWNQMVRWVQRISWLFAECDRIQFAVGFRNPPRQLLKGWTSVDRILGIDPRKLDAVVAEMVDWDDLTA